MLAPNRYRETVKAGKYNLSVIMKLAHEIKRRYQSFNFSKALRIVWMNAKSLKLKFEEKGKLFVTNPVASSQNVDYSMNDQIAKAMAGKTHEQVRKAMYYAD